MTWPHPLFPPDPIPCRRCLSVPVSGRCRCSPARKPDIETPEAPKVYLTNWSSHRTPGFFGPEHRRKLTIMRSPRKWEHGVGTVDIFRPSEDLRDDLACGNVQLPEYMTRFRDEVWAASYDGAILLPGKLKAQLGPCPRGRWMDERPTTPVRDGDTLCCSCSREAASKGECHRTLVASCLHANGWAVTLDGVQL